MLPPRLSKVDIHLLYVFSVVAEARSFAAAQTVLNTAPSTISRQISDLEERLGNTLCLRGRGGFRLTGFGLRVLEASRELFQSLENFNVSVAGKVKTLTGKISIGVIDNWIFNAHAPIVSTLSHFQEQAPDVEIDLHSMAPDNIEYSILEGRIDLGIGVFHDHKNGLDYQTLSEEDVDLFCGRGNPLFSASDIKSATNLLEEANLVRRAYLTEEKVSPIAGKLKSTSQAHQVEGVAMMILTGKYIGYLPETYASYWVQEGRMKSVGSRNFHLSTSIQLATKKSRYQTRASELFMRILEAESMKKGD